MCVKLPKFRSKCEWEKVTSRYVWDLACIIEPRGLSSSREINSIGIDVLGAPF